MVADVIPEEKIAVTLGWLGAANTAGFTVGPVLGGVLFTYGGWWTVFGTLLGMLFLDFCLRCTVTERKRVIEETVQRKMKNKEKKRENGLIILARQPRMICMLCGVVTSGILISAFDAVSPLRKCSVLSADSLTNDFHHRPYLSSSKIASTGML